MINWIEKKRTVETNLPTVKFLKNGKISFNALAIEMLENPEKLMIGFSEDEVSKKIDKICFKVSDNGYKVNKVNKTTRFLNISKLRDVLEPFVGKSYELKAGENDVFFIEIC